MPHFDLTGNELRTYRPDLDVPSNLADFWDKSLAEAPPAAPEFEAASNRLRLVGSFDVTFRGFRGTPISGWLHIPNGADRPLPTVIEYVGYGGGRGFPHEHMLYPLAGYAVMVMDVRGQGSAWGVGHTADLDGGGDPAYPGFLTQGILDPDDYYYRRVYVDAVRAIDAAIDHPLVDAEAVTVAGASQGGGIAIAAASLHPAVKYALVDVPFLCDFPRATSLSPTEPYGEVVRYLKVHRDRVEQVFSTLAYFDNAILGRGASAEAFFSVALMDEVCPPSTVYGAYNWYGGPKSIVEYAYNDHEGGQAHHDQAKLDWLAERVPVP